MKAAIFYMSRNPDKDTHVVVGYQGYDSYGFHIRTQIVDAEDLSAALDMATPRDGETVMNSHAVHAKDEAPTHDVVRKAFEKDPERLAEIQAAAKRVREGDLTGFTEVPPLPKPEPTQSASAPTQKASEPVKAPEDKGGITKKGL